MENNFITDKVKVYLTRKPGVALTYLTTMSTDIRFGESIRTRVISSFGCYMTVLHRFICLSLMVH